MNTSMRFHILKPYYLWFVFCILFKGIIGTHDILAQKTMSPPRFHHISVSEGLSQSTVFCITQDQKQFMWFGTRSGGLNRYDGNTFKIFKHNPNDSTSISNNEVISILTDRQGRLWAGTRKGGLNRFIEKNENFKRYPIRNGYNSTSGNTINALFQDKQNRIWVGSNAGLDVIIDDKITNHPIDTLRHHNISAINQDAQGRLFITDKLGLYIYNDSNKTVKYYPFSASSIDLGNRNFSGPLYIDQQQRPWIGTSNGILTLIDDSLQYPFSHSHYNDIQTETRSIIEDRAGHLWIGTLKGLYHYIPKEGQLYHYAKNDNNSQSLSHNSVYSIFEDNTGIIWIGTWGGGVNMLSSKLYKFQHFNHQSYNDKSLSNNSVSSFIVDNYGLWIGTESGGLNLRAHNSNEFQKISYHKLNTNEHIKALLKSQSKLLYIGSFNGGLKVLNPQTHQVKQIINNEKVFALAEFPKGNIWAGTINGLYRFNEDTKSIKYYTHNENDPNSLSHNFIDVLYTSSNGTLWIGTKEGGLMKYNPQTDNFVRFMHQANDSTSLLSNYIISLEEDKNNNLLVGTSNGINIYNPIRQHFETLPIEKLPDNNINSIVCDQENNYWIASNKGITKYCHNGITVNYDINDGLQSNEFNRNAAYQDQNGNIYLGGINGFNTFHPEQVPINTIIPKILITKFKLSNQTITPSTANSPLSQPITDTKALVLNHDQNDLSFEFAALNYIVPQKNQYAYKLIGYNNDWIYSGSQRVANYTNLKPGDYTFIVKGSNNDNIWNEKGTSIAIHINQPFWKTPLAYALYFLIITLLFILLKWLITMRLEQDNLLKIERIEKTQLEELNQMKLRFFTNVAHEFRTPLTLIAGPLEEIKEKYTKNNEEIYLIHVIQNNVKRLLLLVDELLDFRKAGHKKIQLQISQNSPIDFIQKIIACFEVSASRKNITLDFVHPLGYSNQHFFDQNVLDKIIFNLLSNALKYTPENGQISIKLAEENDHLQIKVQDSGKGIPQEDLKRVFDRFYQSDNQESNFRGSGIGLAYAKRLSEAHHGTIEVESMLNKGTTFTVTIPSSKEEYTNEIVKHNAAIEWTQDDKTIASVELPEDLQLANPTSSYHLLIVEDNKELNQYLSYCFRNLKVTSAYNGKEGLHIATQEIPDLIISDIMMPEMDGLEMCDKLKNQFLTSHIPIILLTAKSETSHKIEGIQTGADAYIEKPFDSKLLKANVQNLLKQREKLKYRLSEDPSNKKVDESKHNKLDQHFIDTVNKTIDKELSNEAFSIEQLAEILGMSRSQLFRKFKALFPYSPSEMLRIARLNYAKQLMAERNYNINEVSEKAGFSSTSYFTTSFKKHFGITPSDYLKNSQNHL